MQKEQKSFQVSEKSFGLGHLFLILLVVIIGWVLFSLLTGSPREASVVQEQEAETPQPQETAAKELENPAGVVVDYEIIDEEDISYAGCQRIALRIVVPDDAAQVDVDYTLGQIINEYQSKWDDVTVWAWGESELADVGNSMYTKGMKEYSSCN